MTTTEEIKQALMKAGGFSPRSKLYAAMRLTAAEQTKVDWIIRKQPDVFHTPSRGVIALIGVTPSGEPSTQKTQKERQTKNIHPDRAPFLHALGRRSAMWSVTNLAKIAPSASRVFGEIMTSGFEPVEHRNMRLNSLTGEVDYWRGFEEAHNEMLEVLTNPAPSGETPTVVRVVTASLMQVSTPELLKELLMRLSQASHEPILRLFGLKTEAEPLPTKIDGHAVEVITVADIKPPRVAVCGPYKRQYDEVLAKPKVAAAIKAGWVEPIFFDKNQSKGSLPTKSLDHAIVMTKFVSHTGIYHSLKTYFGGEGNMYCCNGMHALEERLIEIAAEHRRLYNL